MSNAPQPSIRFFLAREAPVGVLLRRGPSKLVQCLLWNLETDEVTGGQWLSGRLYEERCDLSPDGRLFIYFASNYNPREEGAPYTWTAISRPPYLTALAFWDKPYNYHGGGHFESNRSALINNLADHKYSDKLPAPKIQVGSIYLSLEDMEERRMVRDGWVRERQYMSRTMIKSVGNITVTEALFIRKQQDMRRYTASIGGQPLDVQDAKQVDIDIPRSRIVYTVGGKLLAFDGTSVKEIADLEANTFEPVPPPDWAKEWP